MYFFPLLPKKHANTIASLRGMFTKFTKYTTELSFVFTRVLFPGEVDKSEGVLGAPLLRIQDDRPFLRHVRLTDLLCAALAHPGRPTVFKVELLVLPHASVSCFIPGFGPISSTLIPYRLATASILTWSQYT